MDFRYRSYGKYGFIENLHFDDGTEGGPNYHYDLEGKLRINHAGIGIGGTVYLDPLWSQSQNDPFNFGLGLNGSYVSSTFRETRISYLQGSWKGKEMKTSRNIPFTIGI